MGSSIKTYPKSERGNHWYRQNDVISVAPSVVAGDDNLVVYRANYGRKALSLKNERAAMGHSFGVPLQSTRISSAVALRFFSTR
jgi:hypothetical protein